MVKRGLFLPLVSVAKSNKIREALIEKFKVFTLHNLEAVEKYQKEMESHNLGFSDVLNFTVFFLTFLAITATPKKQKKVSSDFPQEIIGIVDYFEEKLEQKVEEKLKQKGILFFVRNSFRNLKFFPITNFSDLLLKLLFLFLVGSAIRSIISFCIIKFKILSRKNMNKSINEMEKEEEGEEERKILTESE